MQGLPDKDAPTAKSKQSSMSPFLQPISAPPKKVDSTPKLPRIKLSEPRQRPLKGTPKAVSIYKQARPKTMQVSSNGAAPITVTQGASPSVSELNGRNGITHRPAGEERTAAASADFPSPNGGSPHHNYDHAAAVAAVSSSPIPLNTQDAIGPASNKASGGLQPRGNQHKGQMLPIPEDTTTSTKDLSMIEKDITRLAGGPGTEPSELGDASSIYPASAAAALSASGSNEATGGASHGRLLSGSATAEIAAAPASSSSLVTHNIVGDRPHGSVGFHTTGRSSMKDSAGSSSSSATWPSPADALRPDHLSRKIKNGDVEAGEGASSRQGGIMRNSTSVTARQLSKQLSRSVPASALSPLTLLKDSAAAAAASASAAVLTSLPSIRARRSRQAPESSSSISASTGLTSASSKHPKHRHWVASPDSRQHPHSSTEGQNPEGSDIVSVSTSSFAARKKGTTSQHHSHILPASSNDAQPAVSSLLPLAQRAVHLYFLQEIAALEVEVAVVLPSSEVGGSQGEGSSTGSVSSDIGIMMTDVASLPAGIMPPNAHDDSRLVVLPAESSSSYNALLPPIKMKTKRVPLGSLQTSEVVQHYIRPTSASHSCSFMEAVTGGLVQLSSEWCSTSGGYFTEDRATLGQAGRPVHGQATYFVSHAWSYRFKDLVSLIEQHYNSLPADNGWIDVYYWLDIFAVRQNFEGSLLQNPDGDLNSVIKSCQAVLFTIHPLLRPSTPLRLWCLYEAFLAQSLEGVELELLVDDSNGGNNNKTSQPRSFAEAYMELLDRFKTKVVEPLDMNAAQTSKDSDRHALLQMIQSKTDFDQFNKVLKKLLISRMMDALLRHALKNGDDRGAQTLVSAGAKLHCGFITLSGIKHNGDSTVAVLGQVLLLGNSSIQEVVIKRSGVRELGCQALATALQSHPKMKLLDLTDNAEVGEAGVMALAEAASASPTLTRLVLWNTGMGDAGLGALGHALLQQGAADGGNENKHESDAAAVGASAELVTVNKCSRGTLQNLDIGYNPKITVAGLIALCPGVATSRHLTRLSLSRLPHCVGTAAKELGEAVGTSTTLKQLVLSGCRLTSSQLGFMMPGLCKSCSVLCHLDLQENELDHESGEVLGHLLNICKALAWLQLDGNSELCVQRATVAKIAASLPEARNLHTLGLNSTGMTAEAAKALSAGLPSSRISELDLGGNVEIGDKGAASLLTALWSHPTLRVLNLSSIGMTAKSCTALLALLKPSVGGHQTQQQQQQQRSGTMSEASSRTAAAATASRRQSLLAAAAAPGSRTKSGAAAAASAGATEYSAIGGKGGVVGPAVGVANSRQHPVVAGAGKSSFLVECVVSGNEDLPDEVVEAVAAWRSKRWASGAAPHLHGNDSQL
ncbi:hypothetical protein CEUSTIGMA_g2633.t1 [Chlamydomonas eustigma]|uniref:Uncharacterized protein n=1 Tax=Chlamydomonas eustigma TaxID=1157962 RepID=A0A250WWV9_9CHLO|nr:hypothetical protein CEUSTIGMA_g2633.t1 [Chlamydomonas eustigma]|eukprot:GAX75189.1 hypothetical protein CEUSTIGMA_g2633.t1 [Chlamydomonas eustigma]